jgi:hypothetical protein
MLQHLISVAVPRLIGLHIFSLFAWWVCLGRQMEGLYFFSLFAWWVCFGTVCLSRTLWVAGCLMGLIYFCSFNFGYVRRACYVDQYGWAHLHESNGSSHTVGHGLHLQDAWFFFPWLLSCMMVAQCHFMRSGLVLVLLTLFFVVCSYAFSDP